MKTQALTNHPTNYRGFDPVGVSICFSTVITLTTIAAYEYLHASPKDTFGNLTAFSGLLSGIITLVKLPDNEESIDLTAVGKSAFKLACAIKLTAEAMTWMSGK